ncbi:MAG: 23S rRNA (guanosine(2251)-2'-O)-methyltransferase RlmB [Acidimicrobiia bacterium]|nr:23S rRNA (guanosine(2251)-2'-O)-methyltransferase RlmB [Acidimicrobiia bacterium]
MARAGIGTDLEGVHAVAAALDRGRVGSLVVERGRVRHEGIASIVERAEAAGISVELVDDVRDRAFTSAPQGIVAKAEPIRPISIDDAAAVDLPGLLVLDHIQDPRNVGAAARSAVAAGMTGIVVSSDRSAPLGATAFKAAAGALERIPIIEVRSVADALKRLAGHDVWTVGLDGSADRSLLGLDLLALPVAVVVGAEGAGLSRLVAERCDVVGTIPMVGETESLNASVASAIACYEVARVRGWVT